MASRHHAVKSEPKVILITGAGGGIGRVTARRFLAAGWRVGLTGRGVDALIETAQGADHALIVPGDVGVPEQVDRVFQSVADRWGRLDVLFNNAGRSARPAPIDEIPVDEWLAVCQTNITGMVLCARAAFGLMRHQDPQGGRIINNGSISAQVPRPGSVPYTVSKHAVTGLTKTLALDGRRFDITASQIDIGNALTEMTAGFPAGVMQPDGSLRAEPVMDATHVADMVLHLAGLPLDVAVPFVTVMARDMPLMGRG